MVVVCDGVSWFEQAESSLLVEVEKELIRLWYNDEKKRTSQEVSEIEVRLPRQLSSMVLLRVDS